VNVKMRNALADAIVNADKRSLCFNRPLNRARQQLSVCEKWTYQGGRQVRERFKVIPGNQQTMTGENRAMIEKRDRRLVREHDGRGNVARNDSAENATLFHSPHVKTVKVIRAPDSNVISRL
jgi:hypothetical protein